MVLMPLIRDPARRPAAVSCLASSASFVALLRICWWGSAVAPGRLVGEAAAEWKHSVWGVRGSPERWIASLSRHRGGSHIAALG